MWELYILSLARIQPRTPQNLQRRQYCSAGFLLFRSRPQVPELCRRPCERAILPSFFGAPFLIWQYDHVSLFDNVAWCYFNRFLDGWLFWWGQGATENSLVVRGRRKGGWGRAEPRRGAGGARRRGGRREWDNKGVNTTTQDWLAGVAAQRPFPRYGEISPVSLIFKVIRVSQHLMKSLISK